MCHHWTYESVDERLAEREDENEPVADDEPAVEVELDPEYREDRRDGEPVERPADD
jgi:hypothetical protein